MTAHLQFDLIVIGSGAAGESVVDEAQRSRKSIAIIEKDKLGGDCPNYACIPTKALLRSAKVYALLKRADEFGLSPGAVEFDWSRVVRRKEQVVRRTDAPGTRQRYQNAGIAIFDGAAAFIDEHHIRVKEDVLYGDRVMIATGSKPARPAIAGIAEVEPITNIEAISLPRLPASLVILGGGPVGCEFAQLFSTFGVQVTLLQQAGSLLPHEEPELSQIVQRSLEANGAAVMTRVEVQQMAREGHSKTVWAVVDGKRRAFKAEEVLVATGRDPQTSGLDLAAAGVELDDGRVKINSYLQTTCPHIYAGGDVSGPFLYTHFAHYQGALAGWNMFSDEPRPAKYRVVPHVIFTEPEIASVGMTEEAARQAGYRVTTGKVEICSLGKAWVESEETGMVKLVADAASGEILGGHIAASGAGEMIHEIAAAMQARAPVSQVAEAVHAFPTFAEGNKAAALDWLKRRAE